MQDCLLTLPACTPQTSELRGWAPVYHTMTRQRACVAPELCDAARQAPRRTLSMSGRPTVPAPPAAAGAAPGCLAGCWHACCPIQASLACLSPSACRCAPSHPRPSRAQHLCCSCCRCGGFSPGGRHPPCAPAAAGVCGVREHLRPAAGAGAAAGAAGRSGASRQGGAGALPAGETPRAGKGRKRGAECWCA